MQYICISLYITMSQEPLLLCVFLETAGRKWVTGISRNFVWPWRAPLTKNGLLLLLIEGFT